MFDLRLILALTLFFFGANALAQDQRQIELLNSNSLEFDASLGTSAQRLIGDVKLRHKDALMYCDSAYLFDEQNRLEAYGNVRIVQPGKVNVWSKFLIYDGNSSFAYLDRSVRLNDGKTDLITDHLDYNTATKIAYYNTGANITNENSNLRSRKGQYNTNTKVFVFKDNVDITNPDFNLVSDTLEYNSKTKVATIFGPTKIKTQNSRIYCESGWFNTQTKQSNIYKNAYVYNNDGQELKGDTLYWDDKIGLGEAKSNVFFNDTVKKISSFSGFAKWDRNRGEVIMARKPILCYYASKDTFYIMADTIIRLKDTVNNSNQMYAWRNVMLHSNNMYSNSDSMVYIEKDSVIDFYYQPVIWLDEYQVVADKMKVFISDTAIERMELYQNSLIAKLNDPKRFDQTKGKNMQIYFANNDIERLMVQGNGQSIYYVLDDKSKYVGVNKIECTDIKLEMLNNKPIGVHYYNQANGKFTPIRKAQPNDFILDGFNWEGQKRDYTISQFTTKKSLFR